MKVFHGTSYENYLKIKKEGFREVEEKTWLCSIPHCLYCWSPERLQEYCFNTPTDLKNAEKAAITGAFENATITAALNGSLTDKVVVIELNVDEDEVRGDYSCMQMDGAVELDIHVANNVIHRAKYHFFEYNPWMRYFYICSLVAFDGVNMLNTSNLSKAEIELMKELNQCDLDNVLCNLLDAKKIQRSSTIVELLF